MYLDVRPAFFGREVRWTAVLAVAAWAALIALQVFIPLMVHAVRVFRFRRAHYDDSEREAVECEVYSHVYHATARTMITSRMRQIVLLSIFDTPFHLAPDF